MKQKLKAIRGMPDILPKDMPMWHQFERHWHQLVDMYGYEEIRFPILEATALFKRSIGEVTDIIEKEMFTFQSRDEESVSLRPEGTAGCVRAGIEHSLFYHQIQKLWYMGPMFRYERPQKGRYRQFYQTGVETFGLEGPDIEVEHILMMKRLWQWLGIESAVVLQVNSLGSFETRKQYKEKLIEYLKAVYEDLDEDSQRRLYTNPLRILDSKNPALADIIAKAPKCYEELDAASRTHFEKFLEKLKDARIAFQLNPNLVRGLDYYNLTVYEWVTDKLGAQGTLCAGGRYDALVEQLGGEKVPAVGFAVGIERVLLLQQALGYTQESGIDAYLIHVGEEADRKALLLAEELHDACPKIRLWVHQGGGDFKQQFKKADKSGAKIALILGETELKNDTLSIKFLRESRQQISIGKTEVNQFLTQYLGK